METRSEVAIVSAFGRGNWLAAELKNLGLEVSLVDVSDALGRWTPEDWEGPLGFFQTEELLQTQKARLDEEDHSEVVEEGFSIWLKSGPFDLRGPHASYLLERREIGAEVQEYISQYDTLTPKRRAELKKKLKAMPFYKNWLAGLAHTLGSAIYSNNSEALAVGRPLPLFSPYAVRRVSRRGAEKSLSWARDRKVKVIEKAKLKDIAIDGNELMNIEVESEWSGALGADQFVWALSSEETARLQSQFIFELFSEKVAKPDWIWIRYRLDIQNPERAESLPLKWVLIEDLALHWTHANLQLAQKTVSKDSLDIWVRIPTVHRFQKSYIEDVGRQICEILRARLPDTQPKILDYPQDYHYDETIVGPARFASFSEEELGKIKRRGLSNLHFDGPELWVSQDWNGQFHHQREIFENIKSWKIERDIKIEKQKAKEAKR